MNMVHISGNLVKDPELRYSSAGKPFCNFSLAVNRKKNPETGEVITDFFDFVSFGATAELCGNYLKKGNKTAVEGRLQSRSYTDKNGVKRKSIEIIVDSIDFFTVPRKTEPSPISVAASDVFPECEINDEDLPFF